ncbi:putative disease resistance protein RGA1 [Chenopodium quinoa]|uniref:SWIM-type domain-containing protein n=1 Tax=Chenopodium quinoa TaxID=63459 RepID=A0A803L5V6_CHEQI|nr:putative disease resistance protein RGA1 [Chenopodium quinoa]
MAEVVVFGIAEEVLKSLGSKALAEIASAWGFKARLEKLKDTINTIKGKLLDAEERQSDDAVRGWLERLTTVVYAADDLFDEFATIAARKQFMGGNKKVQTFFSRDNQIAFAFRVSRKIKKIREKLADIVSDGTQFNFVPCSHEERRVMKRSMRDQTYSFVDAEEVIGRDDDKTVILDMLLASSSTDGEHEQRDKMLPVITIVGMGGMGKTTLAKFIFNDLEVEECFEMRLWVCVSDVFDIKDITEKILKSATNKEIPKLEMEQLQGQLRKEISDKKYLLVLDDMWNENREKWLELRDLLKVGRKGSKIVVTTRSSEVAKIMGTFFPYELQGLSEERSWELFKKMAFNEEAQQNPCLVEVGKEIVKKCGKLPLAIRTVGSLLYGKEERKWLSIKETSLAKIPESQSDIMSILRLSYHHLWSPLKNCFAYCSLFPKDTELDKELLKELWMAEGFIIPETNENQSLDEAAEDYFQTLLQRGFFQDIIKNGWGAITGCKMHDLMHDLAQEVAGVKCKLAKFAERNFDDRILHLSFSYRLTSLWKIPNGMFNLKLMRTFLVPEQIYDGSTFSESVCQQLIRRFSCLRVLDLHHLSLKSLPSSIGKLIHLRFLNLSRTDIEELPDSITDLQNLQTLNLRWCSHLRTLPENIRKLASLRSLDVRNCALTHMPSGLAGLISLNRLPKFKVIYEHSAGLTNKPNSSAKLNDLKELNNLRGDLHIMIFGDFEKNMLEEEVEANLTKKQGLTELTIDFQNTDVNDSSHYEAVLEGLKPHSNLRKLKIKWYKGQKLPSWARRGDLCITLPYLVKIHLYSCSCQQVPVFSQLRFLKHLSIMCMHSVEYMENGVCETSSSSSKSQGMQTLFFPSLEVLVLREMKKLEGWWKRVEAIKSTNDSESTSSSELVEAGQQYDQHQLSMQFCNLLKLVICKCPELKFLPLCPKVEVLRLTETNERLSVVKIVTTLSTTTASCSGSTRGDLKLKELAMDSVEDQLMSLPKQYLHQLSSLIVELDDELVNTKSLGEAFATLSYSLRRLKFYRCNKLRSISQGLERLTALEKLTFWSCAVLDVSVNEQPTASGEGDEMMPWKAFKTNLRSLQFVILPKMVGLPSGLQHLTNLHYLQLKQNEELREIPEWISCLSSLEDLELIDCPKLTYLPEGLSKLTSLNKLTIIECPELTERCRRPNGLDCPKFHHVPLAIVKDKLDFF